MKLAFDIDDTITAYPTFFAQLSQNHTVTVITSRPDTPKSRKRTEQELQVLGIKYESLHMCDWDQPDDDFIPDELEGCERLIYQKVLACTREQVEAMFDDDPMVRGLIEIYLPNVAVFTP